ncbi:GIY-YIG nuclease family protein [Alicyclobacillus sp. SO9]|uniref:GIY-YIG nuclease family protein n=1 Tax=Alicyclobacillus sp. SO9 TaxID=2665646 RepID=UPI0018E6ED66|nr:GIY-YIG nuclease family protein [Alicyclobacillus sp. SO9]QQE79071.1 GIY-YIG nuclease family protein [Alicyclobacillus sp. SO9]
MFYVYVLRCADDSLYTGYTTDVQRRVKQHNDGKGAKYTKPRRPVTLVRQECYETQTEAMQREYEIKQLPKSRKEALLKND